MKLHFSLSTLLICIGVSALVLSYCMNRPVESSIAVTHVMVPGTFRYTETGPKPEEDNVWPLSTRSPNQREVLLRLAWAEPLALLATLAAIQAVKFVWSKAKRPEKDWP